MRGPPNLVDLWDSTKKIRIFLANFLEEIFAQSIALKLNSPPSLMPLGQRAVTVLVRV